MTRGCFHLMELDTKKKNRTSFSLQEMNSFMVMPSLMLRSVSWDETLLSRKLKSRRLPETIGLHLYTFPQVSNASEGEHLQHVQNFSISQPITWRVVNSKQKTAYYSASQAIHSSPIRRQTTEPHFPSRRQ